MAAKLLRMLPLAATMLALGGCGLGRGATLGAVHLTVTRDFGAETLPASSQTLRFHGRQTVMGMLQSNYKVTTRYGGGSVQSIDGEAGGSQAGQPLDWFYYVNGIEASKGASETNMHGGDSVWWDLHDWSQAEQTQAVVGSFPEPFLHGIDGKRLPVRIECARPTSEPCKTTVARLRAIGVVTALALLGTAESTDTLRVVVGPWLLLRRDAAVRGMEGGPRTSGVYARFSATSNRLELLAPDGSMKRVLGAGSGLVAATAIEEGPPVWIVTGTDEAGAQLAAQSLRESVLADHFAVAVTAAGGSMPVPEVGG
jgi:Domain of unknown function (DUF4430)